MPDLSFAVEKAEAAPYAAAPLLIFKLRVTNASPAEPIHSIALRCQVQIEATRRRYDPEDSERLLDIFGTPDRWSQSIRTLLWTHTSVVVTSFTGSTLADLPVPCTYDFNVAATKYFYALDDGEIPLSLLFSGTVFYATNSGPLQTAPIPWEKEATFRLPVQVWQAMMDHYYPGSTPLSLRRDVFDRLYRYKLRRGLPTWEHALESLLAAADEEVKR
jgi:hypothetical protein